MAIKPPPTDSICNRPGEVGEAMLGLPSSSCMLYKTELRLVRLPAAGKLSERGTGLHGLLLGPSDKAENPYN